MKVEITVLCENTTSDIGALAEHGWSVLIESEEGKFLFDTGGGRGLENNLKFFNKGLEDLEGIILSHHHLDHTGGLERALKLAGPTRVYSHPELFKESFPPSRGFLIMTTCINTSAALSGKIPFIVSHRGLI